LATDVPTDASRFIGTRTWPNRLGPSGVDESFRVYEREYDAADRCVDRRRAIP
jgi:hypothetical protein